MQFPHLKQVSRIKHLILEKYLPPWTKILGSHNQRLCYFDCYAGPGKYESKGEIVDGSPLIALKTAQRFVEENPSKEMVLVLVEDDPQQLKILEPELSKFKPYRKGLKVFQIKEDAPKAIKEILDKNSNLGPSFFLIDPYHCPLTLPIINEILSRGRTEALINFMYYQINRDISNPIMETHITQMFGHEDWEKQDFIKLSGIKRENRFLEYFLDQINAKYKFRFRILFDPEDKIKKTSTKYFLIHASNHSKAVLLMKEVMWDLGDEEGTFEFGAKTMMPLFSETPVKEDLKSYLLKNYKGREIAFDDLIIETWFLPYIKKLYRSAIKEMEKSGVVKIKRITSKTERGLSENDIIKFA